MLTEEDRKEIQRIVRQERRRSVPDPILDFPPVRLKTPRLSVEGLPDSREPSGNPFRHSGICPLCRAERWRSKI
jgi:hypothetical protein